AEASSTLSFALHLQDDFIESAAASQRAIELEPDDWHHWLRLGFISWGQDRIRAARTMLALCPGVALGHWLIATVLAARGAFVSALKIAPAHVFALAALGRSFPSAATDPRRALDAALARAAGLARAGQHREAARVYRDAVAGSPAPFAGWLLPVEPLIDCGAH